MEAGRSGAGVESTHRTAAGSLLQRQQNPLVDPARISSPRSRQPGRPLLRNGGELAALASERCHPALLRYEQRQPHAVDGPEASSVGGAVLRAGPASRQCLADTGALPRRFRRDRVRTAVRWCAHPRASG